MTSDAVEPYYVRESLIHLKILDLSNMRYNESLSDGNVLQEWFQYPEDGLQYMETCQSKILEISSNDIQLTK